MSGFPSRHARSSPPPTPPKRSSSRRVKERPPAADQPVPVPVSKLSESARRQTLQRMERQFQQLRHQLQLLPGPSAASHQNPKHLEDLEHSAARMKHLRDTRAAKLSKQQQRSVRRHSSALLANSANAGIRSSPGGGQKTITTYNQDSESPTKDLQTLVLVMVRQQMMEEVDHLSEVVNDQRPFEMPNMRLKSLIANTPDIIDHWKAAMLEEGIRFISMSCDQDEMAWVAPGPELELMTTVDEQDMVSLPPDKPEISKSQVATEYIQAQRGQLINEHDELMQLFQNDALRAKSAATASADMFERICNCYRVLVQKMVEVNFIERKPETVEVVSNYVDKLQSSEDMVVQQTLTQNLLDAVDQGCSFARAQVGQIMNELHLRHKQTEFEPMRVQVFKN